jgi:hypothetical protein
VLLPLSNSGLAPHFVELGQFFSYVYQLRCRIGKRIKPLLKSCKLSGESHCRIYWLGRR